MQKIPTVQLAAHLQAFLSHAIHCVSTGLLQITAVLLETNFS